MILQKIIQITLIAPALLLYSCSKDVSNGSCEISQEARNHFQHDAASLALEYIYEHQIPDTTEFEIPEQYLNPFMDALGILYDSPNIPYYDSLIVCHRYLNETYGVLLAYNNQETWINNWINGIVPTGNSQADSLILQYNLTAQVLNFLDYIKVTFNHPLNTYQLIHTFKELPGIEHGFPDTYIFFFSKLEGELQGNNVFLRFYLGYGDCFAGCFGYNYWTYQVNLETCSAQYLGMNN